MYDPKPVNATVLYAQELPPAGGGTIFANMVSAYEALSDGMMRMLAGLRIHCDGSDASRYPGMAASRWRNGTRVVAWNES